MGCIVYGLSASDEPDRIRYIGQTTLPMDQRLKLHISAAKKARTPVARWIKAHMDRGLEIAATIIKADAVWSEDEISIIAEYRAKQELLNVADGGEGAPGTKRSEVFRAKLSARRKGVPIADEVKAAISAKLTGRKRPAAECEKQRLSVMGEANHFFGRSHTAEAKAANGKARAKLTEAQVIEIRARFAAGEQQRALGAEYGISQAQVSGVVNGRTYAWVPFESNSSFQDARR